MSKHKTITIHSRLAMDSACHAAGLHKLCRVCGDSLARAFRVQHRCAEEKHTKNLMKVFGIDVSTDDPSIHPESFCHKCQNVIYVALKRADEGRSTPPGWSCLMDGWNTVPMGVAFASTSARYRVGMPSFNWLPFLILKVKCPARPRWLIGFSFILGIVMVMSSNVF